MQLICQNLDATSVFSVRSVARSLRESCSVTPTTLQLSMPVRLGGPMHLSGRELDEWEDRVKGVARAKLNATKLVLRMRASGEASHAGEASTHAAVESEPVVTRIAGRIRSMVSSMSKLRTAFKNLRALDVEMPLHSTVGERMRICCWQTYLLLCMQAVQY